MRNTLPAVILLVETALAVYLAFMAWLLSTWMVDDSQAARMVASDWYLEAVRRLFIVCAVAGAFGSVAFVVNRKWLSRRFPPWARIAERAAILLGFGIAAAGAAGALQFAFKKPFM